MSASITPLRPPATPAAPEFDFRETAELFVRDLGYTASDVSWLCPRATPEVRAALRDAMEAVTGESARLILGTAP